MNIKDIEQIAKDYYNYNSSELVEVSVTELENDKFEFIIYAHSAEYVEWDLPSVKSFVKLHYPTTYKELKFIGYQPCPTHTDEYIVDSSGFYARETVKIK